MYPVQDLRTRLITGICKACCLQIGNVPCLGMSVIDFHLFNKCSLDIFHAADFIGGARDLQLTRRHCILLGKTDKTARKRRKGEDEKDKLKRLHRE